MKIVCTVINDLNYDQRMQRICSSLVSFGHEVKLIGVEKKNSEKLSEQKFLQKRISLFFHTGKLFYLEYNIRFFFILLFTQADVFYGVDLDTILPNYFVSKLILNFILSTISKFSTRPTYGRASRSPRFYF